LVRGSGFLTAQPILSASRILTHCIFKLKNPANVLYRPPRKVQLTQLLMELLSLRLPQLLRAQLYVSPFPFSHLPAPNIFSSTAKLTPSIDRSSQERKGQGWSGGQLDELLFCTLLDLDEVDFFGGAACMQIGIGDYDGRDRSMKTRNL